jgi:hypothetical protein
LYSFRINHYQFTEVSLLLLKIPLDCCRYRDNRHVSMGAEKWLDIELWNSAAECFHALKKRGYRIASTCLGTDSVILSVWPILSF